VWAWFGLGGMHIVGCTVTVSIAGVTLGSTFYISEDTTGTAGRSQPDLTYNRARNEFLVAWRQEGTSDTDIYAQRVKMAGGEGLLGSPLLICSLGYDDEDPAVAATESGKRYLVLWSHSGYYSGWVYTPIVGRELDTDGNYAGNETPIWGMDAYHPALAGGPLSDFFVAYDERELTATHRDVYGLLRGNHIYLPLALRNY